MVSKEVDVEDRIYIFESNPGEIIADSSLKWNPATDRRWQQLAI